MEVLEEWKTREEESWLILLLELICKGKRISLIGS